MDDLRLVEPSLAYREAYLEKTGEWKAIGEKMVPIVLRLDCSDFEKQPSTVQPTG